MMINQFDSAIQKKSVKREEINLIRQEYIDNEVVRQIKGNIGTIKDLFKEIDFLLENLNNPQERANNPKREEIESRKTNI